VPFGSELRSVIRSSESYAACFPAFSVFLLFCFDGLSFWGCSSSLVVYP
jgi:hypothetical protein